MIVFGVDRFGAVCCGVETLQGSRGKVGRREAGLVSFYTLNRYSLGISLWSAVTASLRGPSSTFSPHDLSVI